MNYRLASQAFFSSDYRSLTNSSWFPGVHRGNARQEKSPAGAASCVADDSTPETAAIFSLAMSSLRSRPGPRPPGFIEPALPSASGLPPSGGWIHEIKFDGYRMLARRDGPRVRLFTRNGYDWTERYPLIADAMAKLRVKSCLIDGEAVYCEQDGVPSFQLLRLRRHDPSVFLYAFDLLELDGVDLRPLPLEARRAGLTRLVRQVRGGIYLSDHVEADGPEVFRHACLLRVEGIVSKRKGSPYRSGRTVDWIKAKNPASAAVRREADEDWGR